MCTADIRGGGEREIYMENIIKTGRQAVVYGGLVSSRGSGNALSFSACHSRSSATPDGSGEIRLNGREVCVRRCRRRRLRRVSFENGHEEKKQQQIEEEKPQDDDEININILYTHNIIMYII